MRHKISLTERIREYLMEVQNAQGIETEINHKQTTAEDNKQTDAGTTQTTFEETKDKAPKKKRLNRWARLGIKVGIIAAIILIISCFVRIDYVHTNDMFPSVRDGDLVFSVNFLNYGYEDVVAYRVKDTSGREEVRFGRIIAQGDHTVSLTEMGDIELDERNLMDNSYYEQYDVGTVQYPLQLHEGEYFLLQDYRPDTHDSRTYGAIPKQDILGKIVLSIRGRGF